MERLHRETNSIGKAISDHHPADRVETGNLIRNQPGAFPEATTMEPRRTAEIYHDVIVIGGGQAGLSVSYHLKKTGIDHVVLDGASRVGDVWRNRWDSLRLFTPAKFDGLDGYRFPAGKDDFPTKDQMADYLESYVRRFDLPVRLNTHVERLQKLGGRYLVETTNGNYRAHQIVVAAAGYQRPRIPDFARDLKADIVQFHSHQYRNPGQLPKGPVLLIGAGNSGAEIAMDLARTHEVYLAGRNVGHIPFNIAGFLGRKLLVRLVVRGMFHHVLSMRTPMGRKFRAKMHGHGMPLIRTRPGQLERAGIHRIGKIAKFQNGRAVTDDGTEIEFSSVIWCTGYHPGFEWIDLPVLDDHGTPRQRFGKANDAEGLYFAGLHFQYAVSSTMVAGVGRDARRVVKWIASDIAGTAAKLRKMEN